jgi:hypothetical protein
VGDLECYGLDGALDFFVSLWERIEVMAYWASTPINVFVFECHSPFKEQKEKKMASLLSQALIPSPSPKREKGERLIVHSLIH